MITSHSSLTFCSPERANAPGTSRLEMVIRDSTGTDAYDLEQVTLRIASHEDLPEMTTLSHPWPHTNRQRVCVGHVALQLKTTERIVAFTFGGDLQIQPQDGLTLFILTSPAPILRLEGFDQIPTILANEVAILLAERRGKELPDLERYNRRLADAKPLVLYCACLKALEEKFKDFSHFESHSMLNFSNFIPLEIEALHAENLWPDQVPDLEELL